MFEVSNKSKRIKYVSAGDIIEYMSDCYLAVKKDDCMLFVNLNDNEIYDNEIDVDGYDNSKGDYIDITENDDFQDIFDIEEVNIIAKGNYTLTLSK